MDLVWLEDFLAIAEEGGFSRAAQRRHVTQPALSRRIRSLEEWLGTPLFERSTHTITLTPAGETPPVAEDVLRRVLVGREEALEGRTPEGRDHHLRRHAFTVADLLPEWIRNSDSARADSAVQLVASNFAGCEKLLLDAQAHFMLAHYHPTLVSRLDMDRFQRVDLATDVLIPISAPAAKPGRGGRSSKRRSLVTPCPAHRARRCPISPITPARAWGGSSPRSLPRRIRRRGWRPASPRRSCCWSTWRAKGAA
ncbi:LysR family transcriptional regulator [Bradyrhizobium japonicum]